MHTFIMCARESRHAVVSETGRWREDRFEYEGKGKVKKKCGASAYTAHNIVCLQLQTFDATTIYIVTDVKCSHVSLSLLCVVSDFSLIFLHHIHQHSVFFLFSETFPDTTTHSSRGVNATEKPGQRRRRRDVMEREWKKGEWKINSKKLH